MNGKYMKKIKQSLKILCVFFTASLSLDASELIYHPINPSFGGNPINGSFLLSKASAQNKHKAPLSVKTYAEKFQESLERAYINKIVREITDLAFGETEYDENGDPVESIFNEDSIFVSGDYEVHVVTSNPDSITVEITNLLSGEVTLIEIPRFG
jgi:curli production assembly/transport component CsgF